MPQMEMDGFALVKDAQLEMQVTGAAFNAAVEKNSVDQWDSRAAYFRAQYRHLLARLEAAEIANEATKAQLKFAREHVREFRATFAAEMGNAPPEADEGAAKDAAVEAVDEFQQSLADAGAELAGLRVGDEEVDITDLNDRRRMAD